MRSRLMRILNLLLTLPYPLSISSPIPKTVFFFYSQDRQYIIKTLPKDDAEFFRSKLRDYFNHLQNGSSVIVKIYGLYRISNASVKNVFFVVMQNIFYSSLPIHRRFDLKGLQTDRKAKEEETKQLCPVLKDADFDQLYLGSNRERFLELLKRDTQFLAKIGAMDYSLLLGVHDKQRSNQWPSNRQPFYGLTTEMRIYRPPENSTHEAKTKKRKKKRKDQRKENFRAKKTRVKTWDPEASMCHRWPRIEVLEGPSPD